MHCMLNRIACTCMKIVVASSQKMSNISVLIAIGNMHVVKGRNQLSHESTLAHALHAESHCVYTKHQRRYTRLSF